MNGGVGFDGAALADADADADATLAAGSTGAIAEASTTGAGDERSREQAASKSAARTGARAITIRAAAYYTPRQWNVMCPAPSSTHIGISHEFPSVARMHAHVGVAAQPAGIALHWYASMSGPLSGGGGIPGG